MLLHWKRSKRNGGNGGLGGLTGLVVAGLCWAVAVPAGAATVYHWETEDGVFAYTDDPKHIPSAYKNKATRRSVGRLSSYKRYTPAGKLVSDPYAKRLDARLVALRQAKAQAAPAAALAARGDSGVHVRVDLRELEIDVPRVAGEEPVVVEEVRVRVPGQIATRTVKVIRQGDQTLAIIKPLPNVSDPSQVVNEGDLE